jgi:hypothetical protein
MQLRELLVGVVGALLLRADVSHAQASRLTATCSNDSIVIAFSGPNPTTYPFLGVWRQTVGPCEAWRGVWFGTVAPGQTLVLNTSDRQVSPDSLYHYMLAPLPGLGIVPDGYNVYDAYAGCGAPVVARGLLQARDTEFGQLLHVERCKDSCWPGNDIWGSSVDLMPFLGQVVELQGTIYWYWQWDWVLTVTAVRPIDCGVLAVLPSSWAGVKRLYR